MSKESYEIARKYQWTAEELAEKSGYCAESILGLARKGIIGAKYPVGLRKAQYLFTSLDLTRLLERKKLAPHWRNR